MQTQYACKNICTLNTSVCDINCRKRKHEFAARARGGLYKYLRKNGNLSNPRRRFCYAKKPGIPVRAHVCIRTHSASTAISVIGINSTTACHRWDNCDPWTLSAFLYSLRTRSRRFEREEGTQIVLRVKWRKRNTRREKIPEEDFFSKGKGRLQVRDVADD